MNTQSYKDLKNVLNNKTESEAKKYIIEHFSEFSEGMQEDIAIGLFGEGLLKVAEKNQTIIDLQEEGIKTIGELAKEKNFLDDKLNIIDIKEKMNEK